MNKNLPKMYRNVIDKNIDNKRVVYSTLYDNDTSKIDFEKSKMNLDNKFLIMQKINNIFNAKDFIYKADVTIVTKDKTLKKRIVGKNQVNLITMDGEYIPISSIIDIYK